MCLAIPGKVLETFDQRGLRMASVQFGGIVREACLEYVPETQIGECFLSFSGVFFMMWSVQVTIRRASSRPATWSSGTSSWSSARSP